MISEQLKQQDLVAKQQFPINMEVLSNDGDWGIVVGYVEEDESIFGYHYEGAREKPIIRVRHYFDFEKKYYIDDLQPLPPQSSSDEPISHAVGIFLCKLGIHAFEKEPSRRDLVRHTGIDVLFVSSAIQRGVRKCLRHGCPAEQRVYRTGWCGAGGSTGRWKKMSPAKEQAICSYPIL